MTTAPDSAPPVPAVKPAMFHPLRSPRAVWIGCLSIAVVGLASVAISTRWGAGVSPDSTDYVAAATSLLHGRGVSTPAGDGSPVPMTLWPPLYPLFLALTGALGFELHAGARWLNALLYAANFRPRRGDPTARGSGSCLAGMGGCGGTSRIQRRSDNPCVDLV